MYIAMTQHAKERAVCVEIVGMNRSLIDLEVCTRFVRDAVSAAGKDPVQNSGERPKNRDGEDIAVGDFHLSTAAHGARIAAEPGEIVRAAEQAERCLVVVVQVSQQREIDFAYGNICPVMR